jgi:hypothetical protein
MSKGYHKGPDFSHSPIIPKIDTVEKYRLYELIKTRYGKYIERKSSGIDRRFLKSHEIENASSKYSPTLIREQLLQRLFEFYLLCQENTYSDEKFKSIGVFLEAEFALYLMHSPIGGLVISPTGYRLDSFNHGGISTFGDFMIHNLSGELKTLLDIKYTHNTCPLSFGLIEIQRATMDLPFTIINFYRPNDSESTFVSRWQIPPMLVTQYCREIAQQDFGDAQTCVHLAFDDGIRAVNNQF